MTPLMQQVLLARPLVQGAIRATECICVRCPVQLVADLSLPYQQGLRMLEHGQRKYGIVIGAETMLRVHSVGETAQRLFSLEMALELFFTKDEETILLRKHYKMMDQKSRGVGRWKKNDKSNTFNHDNGWSRRL